MRQGSNNGRRPRGRTNRKQHSGGPSRSHTFDSNGPDGRVRGNARQVYEKYLTLARDAQSSGDRIAAEAYFQHAEHYFRILSDSTDPHRPERRQDDRQPVQNNPAPAESAGETPRDEAAIRVNGEAEGTGPQPDLPIDAGGDKRNGTAPEVSLAPAAAPETDQEAKPAAPKRRGRPRKPRLDDQDAKSRQEDSPSEKENDPAAP